MAIEFYQENDVTIAEVYIRSGRRTIPVALVKPLIEQIHAQNQRNTESLDTILTLAGGIADLKSESKEVTFRIERSDMTQKEIIEQAKTLIEKIVLVVRRDAGKHCRDEEDGTLSHDSVYQIYCGVLDDATKALALLEQLAAERAETSEIIKNENVNRFCSVCGEWLKKEDDVVIGILHANCYRPKQTEPEYDHARDCRPKPWENSCKCGYLQRMRDKQAERIEKLRDAAGEGLSICRGEWEKVGFHPGSSWARDVKYFEQALSPASEQAPKEGD